MSEQGKVGRSGAGAPSGHEPSASAVPASQSRVPNAVERLRRFAVEWKFMQLRSGYESTIYELHPGDNRHAVCNVDDLIAVLETFND